MNVLLINASPRKNGNSSFIINKLKEKYSNENLKSIVLNNLVYKGCQGCLSCRNNNTFCIVDDELKGILPEMANYDLIIIVTPNYYGFVTGQLKLFLDRWYCLKDNDKRSKFNNNTKLFFVVVQGAPNRDHSANIINWSKHVFESFNLKYYGYTIAGCRFNSIEMVELKYPELSMHLNMFAG